MATASSACVARPSASHQLLTFSNNRDANTHTTAAGLYVICPTNSTAVWLPRPSMPKPSTGLTRLGGDLRACDTWLGQIASGDGTSALALLGAARSEAGLKSPLDQERAASVGGGGYVIPRQETRERCGGSSAVRTHRIRTSLHANATPPSPALATYVELWKAGSNTMLHASTLRGATSDATRARGARRFHFTFVREPLGRAVAGAAEYAGRVRAGGGKGGGGGVPFSPRQLVLALLDAEPSRLVVPEAVPTTGGDAAKASAPLADRHAKPSHHHQTAPAAHGASAAVAHGPAEAAAALHLHEQLQRHFAPMSGVLLGWPLDYVGRLEAFEADWRTLREGFDCALPRATELSSWLDRGHDETHDAGFRAELLALLDSEPRLRRALCTLLTPDYMCFGYNLSACVHGSGGGGGGSQQQRQQPRSVAPSLRPPGVLARSELAAPALGVLLAVAVVAAPLLALARRRDRDHGNGPL